MTKTPLDDAERHFDTISPTETNGRFAAIRQVLKDRERHLPSTRKATRPRTGVNPKDRA